MFVFKHHGAGYGNLLIHLSDCWDKCKMIHANIYHRYELSNCVIFKGYTVTDSDEGDHPHSGIYINQMTVTNVHPRMRMFVEPTPHMKKLIEQHRHLIDDVVAAIHIRRGAFSNDSTQYRDVTKQNPDHYHCSDAAVNKFMEIVKNIKGSVYLASDSPNIKQLFINTFGDKIRTLDTEFTFTAEQDDAGHQTIKNLQDVYLEWFLLSMCPKLYITGGNNNLMGFSTFSYTAAIYGSKPFECVFN